MKKRYVKWFKNGVEKGYIENRKNKKITKVQLKKAGWIFATKEGEDAFVNLLNKTFKTDKQKEEFLSITNTEQIIGKTMINGEWVKSN